MTLDCQGTTTIAQEREFQVTTKLRLSEDAAGFALYCMLEDMHGRKVFVLRKINTDLRIGEPRAGVYSLRVQFPPLWLNPGLYTLSFKVVVSGTFGSARHVSDKIPFDVDGANSPVNTVLLHPEAEWEVDAR